jgi:ribosomal protein S18 acetylase RimI-like enzyme
MGKVEGKSDTWHGHVTAVTVAPTYRRMGLAARLMHFLEHICEKYVRQQTFLCNTFYVAQTRRLLC